MLQEIMLSVFGGTGNEFREFSSSPTVGYTPILDNSGGL
jgi:hypothetical protein